MFQRFRSLLLVGVGMLAGLLVAGGWQAAGLLAGPAAHPVAAPGCVVFSQTGYAVCGSFLTYWQGHGGLVQQGYPLSQEFVETSDLNGKPYTVQYFERAVFEHHPENAPPYDVLLSQLGTYLGKGNYPQGFPNQNGALPLYDHNDWGVEVLKSFYNAVNRKEYERAYTYFEGAPTPDPSTAPPYPQFVAGYNDTVSVQLAVGPEVDSPGAGNVFTSIRTVLIAQHTDNSTVRFSGCYLLHRMNPAIDPNPFHAHWHIRSATLAVVPAGASLDSLLAQKCP